MASRTAMIAKRNTKRKNVVAPVILCIPHTMMRSKIIIRRYNNPTIFMTNMPDSSVGGPVSTHGNIAGHRYVAAWKIKLRELKVWQLLVLLLMQVQCLHKNDLTPCT